MSRRRKFGHVRKLPSGRFQASFVAPDGLRRTAPRTFERRAEAGDWLTVQESLVVRGEWTDPDRGKVPFGAYAARWIRERPGLRPRTVSLYEWLLRRYLEPSFGSVHLVDIDPAMVRDWRARLLSDGVSPSMVAKSYRLMRGVMNTAVELDELVRRNPCRIKGAGDESAGERPVLAMDEVFAIADAMPARLRCMVLVATFASLRFGEVTALRRMDIDLNGGLVRVRRSFSEVRGEGLVAGPPKSRAGRRVVSVPRSVVEEVAVHLGTYVGSEEDALVFTGPTGAAVRRGNFNPLVKWKATVAAIGRPGLHFHDLRHTGNTFAASAGVSTRDLMARMGHDSMNAALVYQHTSSHADRAIARELDRAVRARRESQEGRGLDGQLEDDSNAS